MTPATASRPAIHNSAKTPNGQPPRPRVAAGALNVDLVFGNDGKPVADALEHGVGMPNIVVRGAEMTERGGEGEDSRYAYLPAIDISQCSLRAIVAKSIAWEMRVV
jgi:hypothetical protein